MWGRAGLIGATGFVGGVLSRSVEFAGCYNSKTIARSEGESFDVLVCAGAPAVMWAANANPEADRANLESLACAMERISARHLVLISTIAVFDDSAAGYTEESARYETTKAYGRHRRELELRVLQRDGAHVMRLPALFGPGLKKNFIFDLMNPVPSFLRREKLDALLAVLPSALGQALSRLYEPDPALGMMRLDRAALDVSGVRKEIEDGLERIGGTALAFTNSESRFQFYNLENLKSDIERTVESGLCVLNVCSESVGASELHAELRGRGYSNAAAPLVREDMRTVHAGVFGRQGHYLYSRREVLDDLRSFTQVGPG